MENPELKHWGVKGMKWGIRRYQNKDGSLTRAGKKRQAANLEKARQAKSDKKKYEDAKNEAVKRGSASEVLKYKGDLTPAQMKEVQDRLKWENDISGYVTKQAENGNSTIKNIFNKMETGTNYATTAIKTYNTVANVINAFNMNRILPKIETNNTNGNRDQYKKDKKERQKAKEAQQKRAEQESQREKVHNERAEKKKQQEQSKSDEPLKGTVEGKGNSKSNIKNDQDQTYQKKEKPDDYYDPIDITFSGDTTVSGVPATTRSTGSKYVNDILLIEEKYE